MRETRIFNYRLYIEKYKKHWRAKYLDIGTLQQMICNSIYNWKSYEKACTSYKAFGNKYTKREPGTPGIRVSSSKIELIFVRSAISIEEQYISIKLSDEIVTLFGKKSIDFPYSQIWGQNFIINIKKINSITDGLRQIRIRSNLSQTDLVVNIIYETPVGQVSQSNKNVMSIDIGLNNLCAITFRYGTKSYLINGRPLKSINRFINYKIDQIQGIEMKRLGNSRHYIENDKIKSLRIQRDNYVNNYLHQASKRCIDIALSEKCKIIVLGDLTGIKFEKRNRSFVQIPLLRLIELIEYKAKLQGIITVKINEAYTSMTSAIDLSRIEYNKEEAQRRIYRGGYITSQGHFINSDINGSLNILRKFLNQVYQKRFLAIQNGRNADLNGSIPELITFIRDKGFVVSPMKLNIFNEYIKA